MSETRAVVCDACDRDITYTGNSVDYRIVLASETLAPKPPEDGSGVSMVTDMMIYDPLPGSKHFCGLRCLRHWMDLR